MAYNGACVFCNAPLPFWIKCDCKVLLFRPDPPITLLLHLFSEGWCVEGSVFRFGGQVLRWCTLFAVWYQRTLAGCGQRTRISLAVRRLVSANVRWLVSADLLPPLDVAWLFFCSCDRPHSSSCHKRGWRGWYAFAFIVGTNSLL